MLWPRRGRFAGGHGRRVLVDRLAPTGRALRHGRLWLKPLVRRGNVRRRMGAFCDPDNGVVSAAQLRLSKAHEIPRSVCPLMAPALESAQPEPTLTGAGARLCTAGRRPPRQATGYEPR